MDRAKAPRLVETGVQCSATADIGVQCSPPAAHPRASAAMGPSPRSALETALHAARARQSRAEGEPHSRQEAILEYLRREMVERPAMGGNPSAFEQRESDRTPVHRDGLVRRVPRAELFSPERAHEAAHAPAGAGQDPDETFLLEELFLCAGEASSTSITASKRSSSRRHKEQAMHAHGAVQRPLGRPHPNPNHISHLDTLLDDGLLLSDILNGRR